MKDIKKEKNLKKTAELELGESQINNVSGGWGSGIETDVIDSGADAVNSMIGGVNDMVSSGKKAVKGLKSGFKSLFEGH